MALKSPIGGKKQLGDFFLSDYQTHNSLIDNEIKTYKINRLFLTKKPYLILWQLDMDVIALKLGETAQERQ